MPPEYLGRSVWVRWDSRVVRIYNARMQPIAMHVRHEDGRFSTQNKHIAPEKINGIERGATWLLRKTERIGPEASRWAQAMLQARGIQGVRVLQGLIHLADKHSGERIDCACEIALSHEAFRLRTIRTLIKRDVDRDAKQGMLPGAEVQFIDEHPIIRSLAESLRSVLDDAKSSTGNSE